MPKPNGKYGFAFTNKDQPSTNQTSAKNSTISDIFPNLTHMHCLTLIDGTLGYYYLNLHETASYMMTFACQLVDTDT